MNSNNTLIPLINGEIQGHGQPLCDARDLHTFLENKDKFATWIKDRIDQFEFVENQDFVSFSEKSEKPQGGRPSEEYHLTLDMAKELAMVERTAKGKEARRYFIKCERIAIETRYGPGKDEKIWQSAARGDGPYTTHRILTAATRLAIQPGAAVFCVMPDNRVRTFAWRFCYTTNTLITGDINKTLYWMREGNTPIPWEYEEIDGPFRIRPSSDASGVLMAVNDEGEPAPRDLHLLPAAKVILIGMHDEVEAMLDEEGLQFSRFITKRTSSRGFLEIPK
ncbi:antA/AntB antirepressor family protein [Acidithiobacillus ferrivorans]|uniref:antA/AntB antirepressor family protein n=1 Tax=Acidithiobacillus ferrivorans TaxID=160808 RepID=UPI0009F4E732|nr:antA/AntB antirepressor family protein [Acidithiobacillus ferrivorans]